MLLSLSFLDMHVRRGKNGTALATAEGKERSPPPHDVLDEICSLSLSLSLQRSRLSQNFSLLWADIK